MGNGDTKRARQFYAETYDVTVSDWPGEIEFYRQLAQVSQANNLPVLEVACGTGRVARRLAQVATDVVGLDISSAMLEVARRKSAGLDHLSWVQADMRAFTLDKTFGLIVIPGHAFQNLVKSVDQVTCMESIRRHLLPGGTLVVHLDHQDLYWLGQLPKPGSAVFEPAESFTHPKTGQQIRTSRAWSYELATQTAVVQTRWEEIGPDGQVVDLWDTGPIKLHCLFRFEMEHLLARTGFKVEAIYGSFLKEPLVNESEEMVWIARR